MCELPKWKDICHCGSILYFMSCRQDRYSVRYHMYHRYICHARVELLLLLPGGYLRECDGHVLLSPLPAWHGGNVCRIR